MKKLLFSLVLASLWLTGCSTTKTTELQVDNTKVVYVSIPESLLKPCTPEDPPAPGVYMTLTLDERELTLSKYILSLYGTVATCNSQLSGIKQLNKGGANESKSSHP